MPITESFFNRQYIEEYRHKVGKTTEQYEYMKDRVVKSQSFSTV